MNLKWKIVLPALGCALALAGFLAWVSRPGGAVDIDAAPWVVAAGLALLLLLVGFGVDVHVRWPLDALGRSFGPSTGDDIDRVRRGIAGLQATIDRQRNELDTLAERCRRAEEALKLGEERFAVVLRGANDGLWERDLQNARMLLSPRWKGMLGFADDELPDTLEAWRGRVHPHDLDGVEAALARHLEGMSPRFECQLRLLHKDHRYRWMLSRGTAVRHANGRPYRMVGLDTDISAIKRVEHVLEQVVEGTTATYGEDFFRAMVRHFAAALEVPCAFITECADHPPTRVRTLAFWSANTFQDNREYELPGTPCETVVKEGRTCFHPVGVGREFPREAGYESYLGIPIFGREGQVLGHLAFLDSKLMTEEVLVTSVFRIFSARAAAELERKAAIEGLARQFG